MSALLAEFSDVEKLRAALSKVKSSGHLALDAFTPYPVEGLSENLGAKPSRIRLAMLLGGLGVAAFAFGLQAYSAVWAYPLNSGGRPLFSWQIFPLASFETGVFAAALSGVIAFLWACGMPRLHDPLFEVPGFERASQDRYFLLAASEDEPGLRHLLEDAGAQAVTEARQA
jgi:hypothetical protein